MECKHEHIRAVGFKLSCLDCGDALPDDYFERGTKPAPKENAPENEQKAGKRKTKKEVQGHGSDSE